MPGSTGGFHYTESPEHKASKHIFQPRYSSVSQQVQQPQQKFQKLTFNSAAAYGTTAGTSRTAAGTVQRRQQHQLQKTVQQQQQQQMQRKTTVSGTDMQIGPDQQKVTFLASFPLL
jgi:hypothetical protein